MGNGVTKIGRCFAGSGDISRRHDIAFILSDPLDEGFGHSFCYVRPEPSRISSSKVYNEEETTTFRSISGASVSANTSTALSTAPIDSTNLDRAAAFDCSTSFASLPLQPVPRTSVLSGGFLSGPIERGFVSGPIDRGLYSGPIEKSYDQLHRSLSYGEFGSKIKPIKSSLFRNFKRAIVKTISRGRNYVMRPIKGIVNELSSMKNNEQITVSSTNLSNQLSSNNDYDGDNSILSQNLQWAQGKAGEDRVHIVISEEHGWVFVGIYDGFNGPDAPDYLLSNLYSAVHKELKGLLWNDKEKSSPALLTYSVDEFDRPQVGNQIVEDCSDSDTEIDPFEDGDLGFYSKGTKGKNSKNRNNGTCKWEGDKEMPGPDAVDHSDILKALSRALRKTEEAYLEIADNMVMENPELALMGSCVLAMLMKGEDVYLMNVGDSRAILARTIQPEVGLWKANQELDDFETPSNLTSLQLTIDHSTYVEEEVERIKNEHPDDRCAIQNDRVKGYLKVTRAFGAGFLKQPRWNDALLEMFRIDYIGTSPYITCLPSMYHYKLGQNDRFLILSSDGLYQYFTNEDAVYEVESFITSFPEGDPAQHLIEEVLLRAAKKAGIDFHELLDIPQGDRRRYHDDVSIIIISFEGRIWRSSV